MVFKYIGIASALLFLIGDIPYVLDTLKGKTKPHRVTWGIAALLNTIGFANQFAYGATNSLWLFGAGVFMTVVIFIASFRNGAGGRSKTDIYCLSVALIGVILWIFFKSPLYSVLASVLADVSALWPTYAKARNNPETETKISWLIGTISVILDAVSVGRMDWSLLVIPLASAVMQSYMVYLLYIHAGIAAKKLKVQPETAVPPL